MAESEQVQVGVPRHQLEADPSIFVATGKASERRTEYKGREREGGPKVKTWSVERYMQGVRLPALLLDYDRTDVAAQRVDWSRSNPWQALFSGHQTVAAALTAEVAAHGGIRRSFVHAYADQDPHDLFLAVMAWGFGRNGRAPARLARMQQQVGFNKNVAEIVRHTQTGGAAVGWTALFGSNRVKGLAVSFGTKLLYFAGYTSDCPGPRPLILDRFVRAALVDLGLPIPATGTIWRNDYLTYLLAAQRWAQDVAWNESPELVEFALFAEGKKLAKPTSPIAVEPDPTDNIAGDARDAVRGTPPPTTAP